MVTNSTPEGLLLAVAVGNTRTRWGVFRGRETTEVGVAPNESAPTELARAAGAEGISLVAVASVNRPAAEAIAGGLRPAGVTVVRIGRDVNPPLRHALDDVSTLGEDRALTAYAAYSMIGAACVVVDAGTAITVDFVDGEGTFQGGAIAPGVNMMLRALHEQTDGLPQLAFETQDDRRGPFGRDTRHAMQLGVAAAARGLVRDLVERYAEHYEAYPRVVATGGDAVALFEGDGLIERIIPDLQLIGIQRTIEAAREAEDA